MQLAHAPCDSCATLAFLPFATTCSQGSHLTHSPRGPHLLSPGGISLLPINQHLQLMIARQLLPARIGPSILRTARQLLPAIIDTTALTTARQVLPALNAHVGQNLKDQDYSL